jgi:hypothetical protein
VGKDPTGRFLTLLDPLVRRARHRLVRGLHGLVLPCEPARLERRCCWRGFRWAWPPCWSAPPFSNCTSPAIVDCCPARRPRSASTVTWRLLRQPAFARDVLEYCAGTLRRRSSS